MDWIWMVGHSLVDTVSRRQNPALMNKHTAAPVADEAQDRMQQLQRGLPRKLARLRLSSHYNPGFPSASFSPACSLTTASVAAASVVARSPL